MQIRLTSWAEKGLLYIFLLFLFLAGNGYSAAQDTLILRTPENLTATTIRSAFPGNYTVFLTFDDIPDSIGAVIHSPDLSAWSFVTPDSLLSIPSSSGNYLGPIDLTVSYRVLNNGIVGDTSSILIQYEIKGFEQWRNFIDVGSLYVPNDTIPCLFVNQENLQDTLDLGIRLAFSDGIIDSNGVFFIGCEDFEGFKIWRGIVDRSGTLFGIEDIGSISKEEAFSGSFCDSVYVLDILPTLRATGTYYVDPGLDCPILDRVTKIDLALADNELFWVDYNAFIGYTYAYAVTTFDRGYNISSGRQGLVYVNSFTHCESDSIESTLPCPDVFKKISILVPAQPELRKTFVVPNPFRTGGSIYTTPNYDNYADGKVRWMNVPEDCKLAIYTTAGDFVWETEHHSTVGEITWDTRNSNGQEVASGIYLYKIEDSKGRSIYGKLIIIR